MRRAAKVDGNHKPIVQAFRALGCSVRDTSGAGNGLADLVVGKHDVTHLVEVKMPGKKRTAAQVKWAEGWRGSRVHLVTSIEETRRLVSAWDSLASVFGPNPDWRPMPHADSPTLWEEVCRCRNEYETCEVCTRPNTHVGPPLPPPGRVIQDFDADDYNGRPKRDAVMERKREMYERGSELIGSRREVRVTPNVVRKAGGA